MARKKMVKATARPTEPTPPTTAVQQSPDAKYAAQNRDKMAAWSVFFEEHGLPMAEYRQF